MFENEAVQFARLTGEIGAVGLDQETLDELSETMDLDGPELQTLIIRGVEAWDRIKQIYTPPPQGGKLTADRYTMTSTKDSTGVDIVLQFKNNGPKIEIGLDRSGAATIRTDQHYTEEQWHEDVGETDEEYHRYEGALDGFESLLMALVGCQAINLTDPNVCEAIFTSLEGIANNT